MTSPNASIDEQVRITLLKFVNDKGFYSGNENGRIIFGDFPNLGDSPL